MTRIQSQSDFIVSLGFLSAPFSRTCLSIEEVIETCLDQDIKNELDNSDIEFDGLVIKIADTDTRAILGTTNHHPRRAIAYKYPAKQATSVIEQIDFQVGRTGILTPVALIRPVELSGVTISRVTLHNPDFITEKDIRIGDHVVIQRSGEVIPYIVCSIPSLRTGAEKVVIFPETCPVCGESIHKEIASSGNASYYCINSSCPASTKEKIKHFVHRDAMNIEGIGDAIIEQMVDNQIISNYADLYKLSDPQIRMVVKNLPGMGDKKIDNIIIYLEKSKSNELSKIINALGIPQVGEKTAKILSDYIKKYNEAKVDRFTGAITSLYMLSNVDFLQGIHGIGKETISSIVDRMNHPSNLQLLVKLEQIGVSMHNYGTEQIRESEKLQYIRFAISGTFQIPREKIVELLVKQGATYNPNITKNTNLLIVGQNPSSKVAKASKQGIEILNGLEEVEKKLDISFGLEQASLF